MSDLPNERSFLQTTQQLAGIESIGITRLINLRSWQADIHHSPVDKTWVIPKSSKRSYLQSRISLQTMRLWHTFRNIAQTLTLTINNQGTPATISVFPGNWTEEALAAYLTAEFKKLTPSLDVTVTWDPYLLGYHFCPSLDILDSSSLLPYLGLKSNYNYVDVSFSDFPAVLLKGPACINVWTNLTMNTIPVSQYLTCVPINVSYGQHIYHSNYDNSESTLCLQSDINHIRIVLKDDRGNELEYPDELDWAIDLAVIPTIPEGFAPLEL